MSDPAIPGHDRPTVKSSPSSILTALHNRVRLDREPFSDRGSRLIVTQPPGRDRLNISLASRIPELTGPLRTSDRPPYLEGLQFLDRGGSPLAFRADTYPHLLVFETTAGRFQLAFRDRDTLSIGLPDGNRCGIRFTLTSPHLQTDSAGGSVQDPRVLSYSPTADLLKNQSARTEKGVAINLQMAAGTDQALQLQIREEGALDQIPRPFSDTVQMARERWENWFQAVPEVHGTYREAYYHAWWVLGSNLVDPGGCLAREALMPSKAKYIGVWNWDAGFHALALRHLDPGLARGQLRLILDHQREDGMLPDAVYREGVVDWIDHPHPGTVTKPPVLAWTALKIHRLDPDDAFLAEIYPRLLEWHNWWMDRADPSGLAQYHHPYSSGLDDNPLWDHPFPITSPDLNTYLVIQLQCLAEMAGILGYPDQSRELDRRAAALHELMVRELYRPDRRCFTARNHAGDIQEETPFNLYPLWTGLLEPGVRGRLLTHLTDSSSFWDVHPLRTVSARSPRYNPVRMWRGPVWVNINTIFIEALTRISEHTLAARLREETLDLVNGQEGFFEYYHPETGAPAPQAAPNFSWTAAVFIDLVLEHLQLGPEPGKEEDT